MKDLIIVGAGGFGREAYYLIQSINRIKASWNLKGFIDDAVINPLEYKINLPRLGSIQDWRPSDNEVFAMGISSPKTKEKLAALLKSRGASFVTLIGPRAYVNQTVELGEGVVMTSGSIGDCARIGNFVNIAGSMIGQDVVIGDYTTTTGFTNVPSGIVGKGVFLGSHSVILANVGDYAKVCAGSVVFSKVKPGTTVFGNPAKRIEL